MKVSIKTSIFSFVTKSFKAGKDLKKFQGFSECKYYSRSKEGIYRVGGIFPQIAVSCSWKEKMPASVLLNPVEVYEKWFVSPKNGRNKIDGIFRGKQKKLLGQFQTQNREFHRK